MNIRVSNQKLLSSTRDMLLAVGVMLGLTMFANCSSGCKPAASVSQDDAYTTEIIACAATSGYPGAYDHDADMRCRAGVNCKYGVGPCQ